MSRPTAHRIFLSVGIIAAASMPMLLPHLADHAVIAGCLVNLIWIWDKL